MPARRSATGRAGRRGRGPHRSSRPPPTRRSRPVRPLPIVGRCSGQGGQRLAGGGEVGDVGAHQVEVGREHVGHRAPGRRRRRALRRRRAPRGRTAADDRSPGRTGRRCRHRPSSGCRVRRADPSSSAPPSSASGPRSVAVCQAASSARRTRRQSRTANSAASAPARRRIAAVAGLLRHRHVDHAAARLIAPG